MLRVAALLAAICGASACSSDPSGAEAVAAEAEAPPPPVYNGVVTRLLDDDLVNFHVSLSAAETADSVTRYAECAAAQYTLIRGYGFARHVRTNLQEEGGNWRADAVYTISPDLPRGSRTIDAEVTVDDCRSNGIPTV